MPEKGDVTVNDIQKCEFEILVAIDKVCRENKIIYMLSSGTLLCAIRHKGFIPWDDDIDIMMTIDNYKKFLKIGQKALGDKFFRSNNIYRLLVQNLRQSQNERNNRN